MPRNLLLTGILSLLLSLCAAVGGTLCICSSFGPVPGSPLLLFCLWAGAAVLCTAAFSCRCGTPALTASVPVIVLLAAAELPAFTEALRHSAEDALPADLPLALLGCLIIPPVCRALCRRGSSIPALAAVGLPLLLCLTSGNNAPSEGGLFLCLAVLLLLLLTAAVRAESPGQGSRLLLQSLLPAAAALALIFLVNPREQYRNYAPQLRSRLLASLPQGHPGTALPALSGSGLRVDLQGLSSRQKLGTPMLEVISREGGNLYLRGQDFDVYTGSVWESTPGRTEPVTSCGNVVNRISIRTLAPQAHLLLPYYPSGGTELLSGCVPNPELRTVYTLDCSTTADFPFPDPAFLELPPGTAASASRFLDALPDPGDTAERTAQAIGAFLRAHAPYDLSPESMPESEQDFALWFLEKGKSGYCVHFASAAVVLLRSAGIPARYVSGFLARCVPGETAVVTTDDAHAWAEYYDDSLGTWRILDATPAASPEALPKPSAEFPESTPGNRSLVRLWEVLRFCLSALLLLLVLLAGRYYRNRWFLTRKQHSADPRTAALACWQEAKLLARLLKEMPPEELEAIAEKALYSREPPEREELEVFHRYRARCRKRLEKRSPHRRMLDRFWFCAY